MRGRCAASGGGLGHRERIEQSLLLELKQPLPGYDLNDPAEDVGRVAIVPARTRLFGKRQFCETLGELSVIKVAVEQAGIRVELSHRAVAVKPIGEARGVAQQVLDRDRTSQRFERERRLAAFIKLLDADFHAGKVRDVFCHGIVEPELAALHQHHRGDRCDRLRHRIKPKDSVRGHRTSGFDVTHAKTFEIDGTAVLLDQNDGAWNPAGHDFVADIVADALQPLP